MTANVDVVVIDRNLAGASLGGPFSELAESLVHAARALGVGANVIHNQFSRARPMILLGGLNLTPEEASRVPNDAVIYNLEQVSARDVPMKDHYLDLLRRCRVWDYSRRNIQALAAMGVRARLVPVGHRAEMARIHPPPGGEDIDVLFYGAMNERRRRILDELGRRGVECVALGNYYGADRDQFVARAKIILNVHFYERGVFEIVRAAHLLTNRKAVVAERGVDTEIEPDLQDVALFAPYDGLVGACVALLADDARRLAVAERGWRRMSQRDIGRHLRVGLDDLLEARASG